MTTTGMRVSDADRQRAADRLAEHLGAGRLTMAEYDERLAKAYAAVHVDDFRPLFADLPGEGFDSDPRADPADGASGPGGFFGPGGSRGFFGPGRSGEFFGPGGFSAAARDAADSIRGTVRRECAGGPARGVRAHPVLVVLAVLGALLLVGAVIHVLVPLAVIAGIVLLISRRRHRPAAR